MCCKCCQHCLESIYWHLIEKHFCYDENIALYEEDEYKECIEKEEKNNNAYDNLAFYDSVAIIANRSIFCIEPLPEKNVVITQQPQKKLRWWESDETPIRSILVTEATKEEVDKKITFEEPLATIKEESALSPPAIKKVNLTLPSNLKMRKRSLHERRVSRSLTLPLDKMEIPIIRQSSFPKFYLDTPEVNQNDSSILPTPIQAFETPKIPNAQFKFDLRSVVQMAMESQLQQTNPVAGKENRMSSFKDKLKPLKLLRNASMSSLHGNS